MKYLFASILLIAAMAPAHAADLLCTGTTFGNGLSFENKLVVQFDASTLKLSASTNNGWADDTVRATPDIYLGYIYTESGIKYWINFHRYTGEFYMGLSDEGDRGIGKPEFNGFCKHAERKF